MRLSVERTRSMMVKVDGEGIYGFRVVVTTGAGVDLVLLAIILVVALALIFDFTNGFHDTANAIATSISTP